MKIGLVTGEYPPMEGGVGAFTQELGRALAALSHDIHIITSRDARPPDATRSARTARDPIDIGFGQLHPRIGRWRWPSMATIVDIAIRYELDVINIQYQAAAYNMRSGAINLLPWRIKNVVTPIVTFHDLRVPYLFPKAGRLRETAVTKMARNAHGVIVTNSVDYEALTKRVPTPVTQIPIGSNITTYQPNHIEVAEVRQQLGLNADDTLLGYFGFLNESKGAEILLEALARLDGRTHLVFIGGQTGSSDDSNEAYLTTIQARITQLGLTKRVHWTGFLDDTRVSTYLHAADMMTMPYRDGVSLRRGTLMAALAHGRPLISTQPLLTVPELVHGQNIWLVAVDDVDDLVSGIETVAADGQLRQQIARGAAEVAALFSWDKIAMQTAAFLESSIARQSRGGRA